MIKNKVKSFVIILLNTCFLFVFLEGLSSTALFLKNFIFSDLPLAERAHTKYDKELGWVNIPNFYSKNLYGPGVFFKTNSQGFRNSKEFNANIPKNKVRIICSGDSFTLGYGVDNHNTWSHVLTSIDPRLETVNLGQGGYGIDQSYLLYMRYAKKLKHNLHIFALITSDLDRMRKDVFCGYAKPVLNLRHDKLVTLNTPVPKNSYNFPWLVQHAKTINKLSLVKFSKSVFFTSEQPNRFILTSKQTRKIVVKIFENQHQIDKVNGSKLVVVHLPTMQDYYGSKSNFLSNYLARELQKREILFINLIDEFRKLPREKIAEKFIRHGELPYFGAAGHYTIKGNKYIAQILYKKLASLLVL